MQQTNIKEILAERGSTYGDYTDVALTSQSIKDALNKGMTREMLTPSMKESLDMIANKLSRIVNGNPYYLDSWVDIIGYAQLVVNSLEEKQPKQ